MNISSESETHISAKQEQTRALVKGRCCVGLYKRVQMGD